MQIHLCRALLERYPESQIGYLVADVQVTDQNPIIEEFKSRLYDELINKGLEATTFTTFPEIAIWREIYQNDFQVKAKTYRSSLESLVKRVLSKKKTWNINSVVDAYNCCSVSSLLPMGGYDLSRIEGDITLRFATGEEPFTALGTFEALYPKRNHVVYADQKQLLCWLWNHKDAEASAIDEETQRVLFFIDGFNQTKVEHALALLKDTLGKINCKVEVSGILNAKNPSTSLVVNQVP